MRERDSQSGGYYMETTIISGSVVEKRKSPAGIRSVKRSRRVKGNSSERKQVGNREYAKLALARIINCNFGPGDLWLTLTYDEGGLARVGEDFKAADHAAALFLDRLGYRMKKLGRDWRWIRNTSTLDGDTGEVVRLHHHVIVPGEAFTIRDRRLYLGEEAVEDIWGMGLIDVRLLRHQEDFKPIANYIVSQGRFLPDEKKWHSSRNMRKPVVRKRVVTKGGPLKAPSGAKVLFEGQYDCESGNHYIRYLKPKGKAPRRKIGGHKEMAAALAGEDAPDGGGGWL